MTYLSFKESSDCEIPFAFSYMVIAYLPDEKKYAFYNADRHELKPCRFDSELEAYMDIYKYIKHGKVKRIAIIENCEHVYYKNIDRYSPRE